MKRAVAALAMVLAGCPALAPLPVSFARANATVAQVELGRRLFDEKALSSNRQVACSTCHDLAQGGADGLETSRGVTGVSLRRNTPSVLNAAGHFAQFWDGRESDVETQALRPILNADEMGLTSEAEIVARLEGYQADFRDAFPSTGLTAANAALALGAFERTLVTPAPIDRFLNGDTSALTSAQRAGYDRFIQLGCVNCHSGSLAGGQRFERLGDQVPWPDESDLGRFEVTQEPGDRMVFKVASLRNVALTAPYFHDGSATTLDEAVRLMGRHQLGLELSSADVAALLTFLDSLSGDLVPAGADR
jgi:cytochrome c peroxidase